MGGKNGDGRDRRGSEGRKGGGILERGGRR
jgi:hypothetical protein